MHRAVKREEKGLERRRRKGGEKGKGCFMRERMREEEKRKKE